LSLESIVRSRESNLIALYPVLLSQNGLQI